MSVLTPVKEQRSKVHFSQYIRSEDMPAEDPKPAADADPATEDETTKPEDLKLTA